MKRWVFAMVVCWPLLASGQESRGLKGVWKKFQAWMDSSAVRKVDRNYIEVPERPWRVVLRTKTDEFKMDVDSYFDDEYLEEKFGHEVDDGRFQWQQRYNPPAAQSVGFYAGYRGLGFSYSYYLRKKTGRSFSISSTGARYGLNFRLRRFKTNDVHVDAQLYEGDQEVDRVEGDGSSYDDIWVRSVIIDGYYLFNGRRFSQAAAYNQSVIQRRSAGSLMVGAMYHQSSLDLASDRNAAVIQMNGDWGKFSIRQLNLGVGYGYNWVPGRGWLLNAMVMPTVSVFNRVKTHYYDSNYALFYDDLSEEDKATHKPFPADLEDESWLNDARIWETRTETKYSNLKLNMDARLSVTYNWKRCFVNVFGQFNTFEYGYSRTDVSITDWYVRASFGTRF